MQVISRRYDIGNGRVETLDNPLCPPLHTHPSLYNIFNDFSRYMYVYNNTGSSVENHDSFYADSPMTDVRLVVAQNPDLSRKQSWARCDISLHIPLRPGCQSTYLHLLRKLNPEQRFFSC